MSNSKISHDDLLSMIDEAKDGGQGRVARAITGMCRYLDMSEGETLLAVARVIAHIIGDDEDSMLAVALLVRLYAQASCSGSSRSVPSMLN